MTNPDRTHSRALLCLLALIYLALFVSCGLGVYTLLTGLFHLLKSVL